MKKLCLIILSALVSSTAFAGDTYVRGHYRSDGTYVAPHYRSAPNATKYDNWTTKGNVNPYTGREGNREYYNYNNTRGYGSNNSNNNHYRHHRSY